MKGKIIKTEGDINTTIKGILKSLIEKECFDAIFVPARIPSRESFAYLLIKNRKLLESCTPLPPIMPVQGARALKDLTRLGKINLKVLCVMRPCEIRATLELSKLRQVTLENLSFFSFDCPGAFLTERYVTNPEKSDQDYSEVIKTWQGENLRPNCKTCIHFSYQDLPSDLHIGIVGDDLIIVPLSKNGEESLAKIAIEPEDDISGWQARVKDVLRLKSDYRSKVFAELKAKTNGLDNLDKVFADCINCHNCMRVCPICYCRQCFFDSPDQIRVESENYQIRAEKKGGIRFPPDRMLFHIGRMSHMALSCVGCGSCEDGCPMDVPVGQVFSLIGTEVQAMFDYLPGKDPEEPIPVLTYKEDELHEYEDAGGTK